MKKEMRDRIHAFNKKRKADTEKETDLDILVTEILKLPPGQLKKVLTDEVLEVLKKYGYTE